MLLHRTGPDPGAKRHRLSNGFLMQGTTYCGLCHWGFFTFRCQSW